MDIHYSQSINLLNSESTRSPEGNSWWKKFTNGQILGFYVGILGSFFLAAEKTAIKDAISHGVTSFDVLIISKLVNFILMLFIIIIKNHVNFFNDEYFGIIGYIIGSFTCTMFLFISVSYISTLDSAVLLNTNVIFAMALSVIFLKRKIHLLEIISALTMLVGIIAICQPSFLFNIKYSNPKNQLLGVAYGIASSFTCSIQNFSVKMAKKTDIFVLLCISSLILAVLYFIIGYIWIGITWHMSKRAIFSSIFSGFMVALGCFCQVKAFKIGDLTIVSLSFLFEIVFIFVFQVILVHQLPSMLESVGIILILISTIAIVYKSNGTEENNTSL